MVSVGDTPGDSSPPDTVCKDAGYPKVPVSQEGLDVVSVIPPSSVTLPYIRSNVALAIPAFGLGGHFSTASILNGFGGPFNHSKRAYLCDVLAKRLYTSNLTLCDVLPSIATFLKLSYYLLLRRWFG